MREKQLLGVRPVWSDLHPCTRQSWGWMGGGEGEREVNEGLNREWARLRWGTWHGKPAESFQA